eukprot:7904-Rhodomonas_salina.2
MEAESTCIRCDSEEPDQVRVLAERGQNLGFGLARALVVARCSLGTISGECIGQEQGCDLPYMQDSNVLSFPPPGSSETYVKHRISHNEHEDNSSALPSVHRLVLPHAYLRIPPDGPRVSAGHRKAKACNGRMLLVPLRCIL